MLLSIGLTEIAIIVCACLAAAMIVLSIVASAVSRAAEKKKKANTPEQKQNPVSDDCDEACTVSEPVVEEPAEEAEEAVAEELVEEAEEPVVEEPAEEAEEAVAEELVEEAEEVVAEEPVEEAEEAITEEPVAEEPVAEESVAEESVAEESVPEEHAEGTEMSDFAARIGSKLRYNFSFLAKLIQSPEELQTRYGEFMDDARSYRKVKATTSWKQVRISAGRNVLALALFKGKKICIAYALEPSDYADSKYGGTDVSEVKRLAKTPYLIKLTSARKTRYAKELFAAVAQKYGLIKGDIVSTDPVMPYRETEELVDEGLVKIVTRTVKDDFEEKTAVKSEEAKPPVEEKAPPTEEQKKPSRPRGKKAAPTQPKKQKIEKQEMITAAEAAEIADEAAEKVLEKKGSQISRKEGVKRAIVNVDTLSQNYSAGESVTIESLVEKGLVPAGTNYVKVLARGLIDKPLHVHADDYSMDAVKMIAATGGIATKHIEEE